METSVRCLSSLGDQFGADLPLRAENGMHFSEGGYDAIATKLFKELNADTYYLEYDTDRAGGFEVSFLSRRLEAPS